jgi:hypothetical protein
MIMGRMWHRGGVPDDDTLTDESRQTGTHDRSPLTWIVAVAVGLVIAGAALFGLLNRGTDEPDAPSGGSPEPDGAPSVTRLTALPPAGRCMLPNVDVLREQTLAVDGVVRSVTEGKATLEPQRFYAGDETDLVVVTAPDRDLQALLAAVDFEEGRRYLVSATEQRVTLCGFSGRYTPELADLYAEAYGG